MVPPLLVVRMVAKSSVETKEVDLVVALVVTVNLILFLLVTSVLRQLLIPSRDSSPKLALLLMLESL